MKIADRPRVLANFARSVDGKVSTRNHTPSGFTSPRDKATLLAIRALGDAVIAGRNTVAADTMSMALPDTGLQRARRKRGQSPEPIRVIISGRGRFDPDWKVFTTPGAPRILFSTSVMPAQRQRALASLADIHLDPGARIDLPGVLRTLRRDYDVETLVCEGGPGLFRSLAEIDAIDEIFLTVAPVIFGGAKAPTLTGTNPEFLTRIRTFTLVNMDVVDAECYLHYVRPN